jgi:hypothetical protein
MRGIFIFGALLALVGWVTWRLYPRQQRELDVQVKDYELKQDIERTTG